MDSLIDQEHLYLLAVLQLNRQSAQAGFKGFALAFKQAVLNGKQGAQAALKFSDACTALRLKLNASSEFKAMALNLHQELVKLHPLKNQPEGQSKGHFGQSQIRVQEIGQEKGQKTSKKISKKISKGKCNFNLICNYKKRREEKIEGKQLYDEATCLHLLHKTFKKTVHDIYEVLASHTLEIKLPADRAIRIDCIGGGPGSDLSGALSYLVMRGHRKFDCRVWDFNYKTWAALGRTLPHLLTEECRKLRLPDAEIIAEWRFLDLSDEATAATLDEIGRSDLVICCWVLNQFGGGSNAIWKAVRGYAAFVEGEAGPLQSVRQVLLAQSGVRTITRFESNPRSMFVIPT